MTMTLDQFAIFAAIARHRNLTNAAAELRVSQPWVSQQLKLLEEDCGAELCERYRRGVELTAAGKIFLKNVLPILDQTEKVRAIFRAAPPSPDQHRLRVGGSFASSTVLLPSLLARFKKLHPGIEINLGTGGSNYLERLLLGARAEVVVSSHPPRSADLAWEPFRRERLVLFISTRLPLARKPRVTLSDIAAAPLVIRGGRNNYGTTERVLQELRGQGLEFKVAMRCDEPVAVKAAVEKMMGVGIAFEDSVKAEVQKGQFKILSGHGLDLVGESFIVYHNNRPLSALGREFLEMLRQARAKSRGNTSMTLDTTSRNNETQPLLVDCPRPFRAPCL